MSLLHQISTGISDNGPRIVIAGQEKMGKTSLACQAPNVLLIPTELGYGSVEVPKLPMIESYDILMSTLDDLIRWCAVGTCPYQSLAFDSVTAIERLIHEKVISLDPNNKKGSNTMESCHGGFGKGYNLANQYFEDFLVKKLDILSSVYKRIIILTCHVFAAEIVDPNVGTFNSWDLLLHSPKNQKTYGKREFLTQWADVIGFLYEPLLVIESDKKDSRAISQNKGRVLGLSRTPSYVAGNRYQAIGEISISKDNGWNEFAHKIYQSCGKDIYRR